MEWRKLLRPIPRCFCLVLIFWVMAFARPAIASEYHGLVTFGGLPLPGATVTVTQSTKKLSTVSDQSGMFTFTDLTDGPGKIEIEMQCFSPVQADITITPGAPAGTWELTLLPIDQIAKLTKLAPVLSPSLRVAPKAAAGSETPVEIPKPAEEANQQSSDGFLVNGSVNNAATSRFSLDQAFGNRRSNSRALYNGGFAAIVDNSTLDARPYSLSGLDTPKPAYNRVTAIVNLGGPLRIPHLLPRGPTFYVAYEWTRNHTAATEPGLVPTEAERTGDLSDWLTHLASRSPFMIPPPGCPFPAMWSRSARKRSHCYSSIRCPT